MDPLTLWEINFIIAFQSLGDWLEPVMSFFTTLGYEQFYLLLIPLVYWCIDSAAGLRIGAVLMLTNVINSSLKLAFHAPRPYWLDTRVTAYSAEPSFGLPSGHAQTAASVWGVVASQIRRRWAWAAAVLLTLMIGISRLFLGVHFVRDVVVGWLIGILLLLLFLKIEGSVARWFRNLNLVRQITVGLLSSLGYILLGLLALTAIGDWQVPAEWIASANLAAPETPIHPLSINAFFTAGGTWFGLVMGVALCLRSGGLPETSGMPKQQMIRYTVGLIVMLALYVGLDAIFPDTADLIGLSFRFLRYALIGLWVAWGAPVVFQKLGLMKPWKQISV